MAGIDNSNKRSGEIAPDGKRKEGADSLHQDAKQAYKEHAALAEQIKQVTNGWTHALGEFIHPDVRDSKRQADSRGKFAESFYKASAGKIIESTTDLVVDGIKFAGQEAKAAREHDVEATFRGLNPLRPVGEIIGSVPKIAETINHIKPQEVLDKTKTPEGFGALLGGVLYIASQFEMPGGNKLKAASEFKVLAAGKEISNVSQLEADAHRKYAFLKKASDVGHDATVESKVAAQIEHAKPSAIVRAPESAEDFKQLRLIQKECLPGFHAPKPGQESGQLALEIPGKGIVGYAELEGAHIYALAVLPEYRGEATKLLFKAISDHCRQISDGWLTTSARRDTAFRYLQAQAKRGNIELEPMYEGKAPDGHIYHTVKFRFKDKASKT